MKIKKLAIHGFKSFVDKAVFNFPSGTSGIIGPNGCGKSNIVDSIRWVLGEQNARHLRGKLMEDIIFNGSEKRKPMGMAEVVLTFSNEDGQGPARLANFTEIEISRRLYRSGESEYYINKVQSRLRDVVELFTDTGIGTRAYSIIEQGQVGWLVNAKPEERRVIFEEAAGINKFKHKKEAALRRLESTKENLTRVNDIISEVKRQLNSLNRQAKKAERYKELKEELKGIELNLSSFELGGMKSALHELSKKLESARDEELALSTKIGLKEESAEALRLDYLKEENAYKDIRERIFGLEKVIQSEERTSALANMRIDEIKRSEERLAAEIAELDADKRDSIAQMEALRASILEIGATLEGRTRELNENSASLDSLISALKVKEAEQSEKKQNFVSASARLSDIKHSIQSCLKEEEHHRIKEARNSSEKEEVTRTLASNEGPIARLKESISGSMLKKDSIEEELRSIRTDLESAEQDKIRISEGLKALKDDYAKASARLTTLEEMERNFESLNNGPREIMLKRGGAGIYGLLADAIETNPGYEKAVEAVMGDRLEYIIVESHKEGIEAIEYLKTNTCGKGSFVPVKGIRPSPLPVQAGGYDYPGTIELLGEVKIKDGYQAVVNSLLGDVLVVEDLNGALELWKQNGLYKTIVTLEGDMIDPQGIITGGASSAGDGGILQKRGEIKRIKALTLDLGQKLGSIEGALSSAEERLVSSKGLLDDCRERLHAAEIERVNLESGLKIHEEEASRLKRTLETLGAEITEAGGKLAEISRRKVSLVSERETLENELIGIEASVTELSEVISVTAAEKERLSGLVTELRVFLAQTEERYQSFKKQVLEKESSVEDADKRIKSKNGDVEAGRIESTRKLEEIKALKARLEELLSAVDVLKKEEVTRNEALTALAGQIKELETDIRDLKSKTSELQELKGELSIEIKETELSIANLKERMIERYGSDIESFSPAEAGPGSDIDTLKSCRDDLREQITSLGEVSLSALEEYAELERRHQFLMDQHTDLTSSVESLHAVITRINRTTREKFRSAFEEINRKFQETFPRFFNGGRAELRLSDDGDILESGVEIVAQPPGKKLQSITLLSGGEKALTATSLIFAIFLIKPSPFCLLDEVDAPLDDANIDRFNSFVKDMSKLSQFVLITHNKKTMEMADVLYGITMEEPGISKTISVKL